MLNVDVLECLASGWKRRDIYEELKWEAKELRPELERIYAAFDLKPQPSLDYLIQKVKKTFSLSEKTGLYTSTLYGV